VHSGLVLDNTARHGNLRMTDIDEVGIFKSLRDRGSKILNCDSDRLAILASASELLGQLPLMILPKPGSCIVVIATDFPAVTRPWIQYAAKNNCSLQFVDDISTENITERLIDRIDHHTAVVAVSSVQYSTGSVIDIPRLREATRLVKASLIVDVTQGAGVLKIDSKNWDADVVVSSGYKWLGGHGGVAIASVSPNLLEQEPPLPGWMSTPHPFDFDATKLDFAKGAHRFTQSTMSYISITGLTTALDQLLLLDENQLESHARELSRQLIQGVSTLGWRPFRDIDDSSASPHIIALFHPNLNIDRSMEVLHQNNIICGTRNGRIRISIAPYNNSDDIRALIEGLKNIS
jgi:cysteine desulfurase/selenocysteine lyase